MESIGTSGSGDIQRTLELLWEPERRPTRGPKPTLSVERIVLAAIEVADAEGIDAVSMRRLSTELGTGTMSLYRYLPGKAELLDLMLDRVQKPSEEPTALGTTWREAVEILARETFALYRRHPWLLQINQARPVLGPATLDGMEKMLALIRPMGLSDPELLSVLIMVDGYVSGVARSHAHEIEATEQTGRTDTEFWTEQGPYLDQVMRSGRYPMMASLSPDTFGPGFDHFEFGLQRILAGLDTLVAARGADPAPVPPTPPPGPCAPLGPAPADGTATDQGGPPAP
ncbi:TetR/AcrR family transcriptional regulator [Streptomyces uncialis]|uniref:TetR/AcrR family transcriptional regulator n=1 Tax=Streptomyces uncialis TaxID=1048205 RepID=UPI002E349C4D|nr:TetR/AcrR family transcriptional regulator [Streptomyces uncialis]